MDIKATHNDDAVVLEPAGMIDPRGALHLEREINFHFEQGLRRFTVDLARVELITSAGIRVEHRLQHGDRIRFGLVETACHLK